MYFGICSGHTAVLKKTEKNLIIHVKVLIKLRFTQKLNQFLHILIPFLFEDGFWSFHKSVPIGKVFTMVSPQELFPGKYSSRAQRRRTLCDRFFWDFCTVCLLPAMHFRVKRKYIEPSLFVCRGGLVKWKHHHECKTSHTVKKERKYSICSVHRWLKNLRSTFEKVSVFGRKCDPQKFVKNLDFTI